MSDGAVEVEATDDTPVRRELEAIRRANGGVLREEDVVEFAKDPATALHSRFQWDDGEAARQYRLHQARNVIVRCRVAVVGDAEATPIRAYVSLRSERTVEGGGYRTIGDVMGHAERREELLRQCLAEYEALGRKYRILEAEIAPIYRAVEAVAAGKSRRARKTAAPAVAATPAV